ncbi:hypothetical protein RYX56_14960 [Alkalihalophilus lindianensis]|uniref:Uncharacterized protein n=1 Tax=Alkalihalophilus lindianensis TaxID=1630542 RepID=A0ABU3XCU6_9BACI|nr:MULTISPECIES: hypothetical protein [Bacillaceae]KMJ56090.1 hypothetical protein AB685_23805 [Bacillus sp. LL01]MDV2685663.1 hypothetical protein [Alkalihalophilus lindianensis]
MFTEYLEDQFGILKEDELISPKTNKKISIQKVIILLEEKGKLDQVIETIEAIKSLGRKGVITYLSKFIDLD